MRRAAVGTIGNEITLRRLGETGEALRDTQPGAGSQQHIARLEEFGSERTLMAASAQPLAR
jgi:hypothetical protein